MAMPETAEIWRKTRTPDGAGGRRVSENLVGETECQVQPLREPETRLFAQQIGEREAGALIFPTSADVLVGDAALINGERWELIGRTSRSFEVVRRMIGVRR